MSLYLGDTPIADSGNAKANTDLSNLTNNGKNIANWSNNVTNCITEIPQDIKLELNNGTLTLKAGSKVYVPNGFEEDGTTPKFDVVTVESDLTITISVNAQVCIFYKSDNTIGATTLAGAKSGTTQPSGTGYWYDTTNNIIKRIVGGVEESSGHSFSLSILTCDSTQITSIDQVFNGFGYIGSTVFALPGIKGLIPNGRNADGTLRNTNMLLNKVCMLTLSGGWSSNNQQFTITEDGDIGTNVFTYNEYENYVMYQDEKQKGLIFAQGKITNTKIDNIYFKTAFHALDYNDSSTISGWSMPSDRYIDLTLGASDSTYTAPANGWFLVKCEVSNKTSNYESSYSTSYGARGQITFYQYTTFGGVLVPMKKGQSLTFSYQSNTSNQSIRFYYAQGEQ